MKIEIFDPPMCCASGVCGPSVDSKLVQVQNTLRSLEKAGIEVARFSLSSDPQAFVDHSAVAELLRSQGNDALPATFVDGTLVAQGRYLEPEELQKELARRSVEVDLGAAEETKCGCGPKCC